MVKIVSTLLLLFAFSFAAEVQEDVLLTQKIKSFIKDSVYEQNKAFIGIIFSPTSNYYDGERIDVVKVLETLKDNGLLNLFFKNPEELHLTFKTSGPPLFFVKIMGDSLRDIGYYRYVTTDSNLNDSEFTWTIALTSEYATDPMILQNELKKSGCNIIDIKRESPKSWEYTVDMTDGYLDVETLEDGLDTKLKRSLYAHWLNVSKIDKLVIKSSVRNNWYPYIAYYDSQLHLLNVIKQDRKTAGITLDIPSSAKYIKVSDLYTLKNIKDDLELYPTNSK
jgi:hypothetical protein